ncbi:MAG: hypothetical protein ACREDS_06590 [Limisphaerales bacterium]
MAKKNTDLARQVVTNFIEHRTSDLAQFGKLVVEDCQLKESVKKGLIEIAKGEESFEDIHLREAALNVMAALGLTKSQDVHRKLCDLFTVAFDKHALQELAAFEALPKTKRCGLLCSRMNFLQSLLRALLHVNEERGLVIGREVAEIFAGTRFSGKITRWVTSASQL